MNRFEIVARGKHADAVFPTFVIPARDRADAERRAANAVGRGQLNAKAVDSGLKGILVTFAKRTP